MISAILEPTAGIPPEPRKVVLGSLPGSIPEALTNNKHIPRGYRTQYLRSLIPKTIQGIVFGARVPKYWVLGGSGKPKQGTTLEGPATSYRSPAAAKSLFSCPLVLSP